MSQSTVPGPSASFAFPYSILESALGHVADTILLLHRPSLAEGPRIVYVNPQIGPTAGYDVHELLGKPISVLSGLETNRALFNTFGETLGKGETTRTRLLLYRKDRSAYWADVSIQRVEDHASGGRVFLYVSHNVDAEVRLQVFADMDIDMLSRHDALGTYLAVSSACEALMGYSAEELIGRRSAEFIHPDDVQRFATFANLNDIYDVRYRMLCKDGGFKWVESRSRIVRNPEDTADINEVHAITRDITEHLRWEREVRESADRYLELFEANPSPSWIYDPETLKILAVNRQALTHYGYSRKEFAALSLRDIRPAEDVTRMVLEADQRTSITHDHGEWRHFKSDHSEIDVHVVSTVIDWEGRSARLAIIRDITDEKRVRMELNASRDKLERSQAALSAAQTVAHIGSWDFDIQSKRVIWTDELYRIYGLNRDDFPSVPGSLWQFEHPDDIAEVRRQYEEAFKERKPYSIIHRIKRKDRTVRWVHENGNFEYDANGDAIREVGTVQDITDRKVAEDKLAFLAHFDALTKLPNRILLQDRLQQAIHEAKRNDALIAVAFLDLDHFKHINDSLGHRYGDLLLKKVARRLSGSLRQGDTLCRYSGDEFILVLGGFESLDGVGSAIQRVIGQLTDPFRLGGKDYQVSASVGVSVYPADGGDLDELVKHADVAMYQAKTEMRSAFRFYSPDMQEAVDKRVELERELRSALEKNEFRLFYQPIVELTTGTIVSAEALLRWQHPRFGLFSPLEFIPVAEDTGLIIPIGRWVIQQACADLARWQSAGCGAISVAVNVSPVQFRNPDLAIYVSEALHDSGIAATDLHVEITESLLMDFESAFDITSRLTSLGVRMVLDDFGTGFSSLGRLGRFPIRGLKIDTSFVERIEHDEQARTISRAIVSLARNLSLETVAEGIETESQVELLRQFGCTIGQGYYFHRPMAEPEFQRLLADRR